MKLLKAEIYNFGSYDHLSFEFNDLGLSLISGPTGSGKSTLQDIPTWALFGQTSKNGNVDEVRSWNSPNDPTIAILELEAPMGLIKITRVRGKSSSNDLYFEYEGTKHRGKDITETQSLLDDFLGISYEMFTASACFNEFSPTSQFFSAKGKERRAFFENLADLSLPVKLAESLSSNTKATKRTLQDAESVHARLSGKLEELEAHLGDSMQQAEAWSVQQAKRVEVLRATKNNFETLKASKIEALQNRLEAQLKLKEEFIDQETVKISRLLLEVEELSHIEECSECGAIKDPAKRVKYLDKKLKLASTKEKVNFAVNEINPLVAQIERAIAEQNQYDEQINDELVKTNPFISQLEKLNISIKQAQSKEQAVKLEILDHKHRIALLSKLQDLTGDLRVELLRKVVKEIESETNRYLETYFDAELRVSFSIENGDNLEVILQRSGYECVFRQLSKGQRGLLKLCFATSVMKASANKSGIHFDALLFDEALDGLDTALKLKAFNLFSELSTRHSSVLVIDHDNDLKNMFERKFHVTLKEDGSTLEEA